MTLLRRGRQLGQAVKNAKRLRQILSVFAKYGFSDILARMPLGRFTPASIAAYAATQSEISTAERLRKAFEELGPTWVKLGQLLSTRPDLIPENYIEEFTRLQDNVNPVPFEIIAAQVEKELGKPLQTLFASFEKNSLAAASVSQVHLATLHGGERVVVKIQRPEIQKIIDTDVSLLAFLAAMLEKYIPESRVFAPNVIVREFFRTLSFELDFAIEANNMRKIATQLKDFPDIVIPKAYSEYSTHKILTLERLEGIPFNHPAGLDQAGIDRKKLLDIGARAFFKCVLIDGVFHGDLHGGNLFALPNNRLGIIDFGIVGRLSQKSRGQLANMVMALLTQDFENLCYQYAELGAAGGAVDFDSFEREVQNTLGPYMGLALNEINMGKVLIEATRIATRYNIQIPGDWMLVFKALLTTEGMARALDPSFDMMSLGQELAADLVKNQYSLEKISRQLTWTAKDFASLLQILPRQLRWMLQRFAENDYALELKLPQLEETHSEIRRHSRRQTRALLAGAFMIAASLSLNFSQGPSFGDFPAVSVILAGIALLLTLRSLWR